MTQDSLGRSGAVSEGRIAHREACINAQRVTRKAMEVGPIVRLRPRGATVVRRELQKRQGATKLPARRRPRHSEYPSSRMP
ncbi:hypothetical protein D3C86_999330 [compost metagenome]